MAGEKVEDTGAAPKDAEPPPVDRIAHAMGLGQEIHFRAAVLTTEVGADAMVRDLPEGTPDHIKIRVLQLRRDAYKLSRHFAPDLPPIPELESGDGA